MFLKALSSLKIKKTLTFVVSLAQTDTVLAKVAQLFTLAVFQELEMVRRLSYVTERGNNTY
jgi:hypothetical protein